MMGFAAEHVTRSGTFVLPAPPARAFSFFSPEGERSWIPEWAPEYLHPRDGMPSPGLVFRTRAGGEETLWLVVRYDPETCEAEYVRVVPESRIGTVVVRCRPGDAHGTRVEVTYALTAVSAAGNVALTGFTEDVFGATMMEWQRAITAVLFGSSAPQPS